MWASRIFGTALFLLSLSGFNTRVVAFSAPNRSGAPQRRRTRASGERRRPSSSGEDDTQSSGPKSDSPRSQRRPRREGRQQQQMFDPKKITSDQKPNEDANPLDLYDSKYISDASFLRIRSLSSVVQVSSNADVIVDEDDDSGNSFEADAESCKGPEIKHEHFEQISLDDLFPGLDFSNHFFTNGEFRQAIRVAMRKDIFFTTPAYVDLSPKVAAMMLDDDSSLQGTWNCIPKSIPEELKDSLPLRMTRLTEVLRETLGTDAPTGDEFMMALGGLCGTNPTAHWIDIIGVKDRVVSHSWHQDTGVSYDKDSKKSRYTVMLGFPLEDEYCGCGVFSHAIPLKYEHLAPSGHNENEPVLFQGTADDEFIIRPKFSCGREILR